MTVPSNHLLVFDGETLLKIERNARIDRNRGEDKKPLE